MRPKRNVLIIDDSAAARASIARQLQTVGYKVFELSSAIGATRSILRNDVSAVIVDLSMPGLSGDKLVGVLRDNRRLDGLLIIVISGTEVAELDRIQKEGKVDAVMSKHHAAEGLVQLLEALYIARERSGAAAGSSL